MKLSSIASRRQGFTLLEIMLVVMIIALLAGSAIFFLGDNLGIAQETRVKGDLQTISTSLMVYQGVNGTLPSTEQGLKALVTRPDSEPRPTSWRQTLKEVPLDPWKRPYMFESPGQKNPDNYDLFSAGKDGKPRTADDIGNWKSES